MLFFVIIALSKKRYGILILKEYKAPKMAYRDYIFKTLGIEVWRVALRSIGLLAANSCSNKFQIYKIQILFINCLHEDNYIKFTILRWTRVSKI